MSGGRSGGLLARRLAGTLAQAVGAHRVRAAGSWRAVLFHHLCDGERWRADSPFVRGLGVSIARDDFVDCVRYLARAYDVVGLSQVVPDPTMPDDAAPRAAIAEPRRRKRLLMCFDDAYASVVDLAAPVLAELDLPWCFFVNPALVGNATLSADNAAAYVANTYGLAPLSRAVGEPVASLAQFIHSHFAVRTPAGRRALVATLLDDVGVDPGALAAEAKLYLEVADVRRLADAGVEIGNHTAEHVHCRGLDDESARAQIVDAAAAVATMSGRPVRGFAYPYGNRIDRTELATHALKASGHACAFLVHNRANRAGRDPFGLYRISLDSGDPRVVASELEVLPMLRAGASAARAATSALRPRAART